MLNYCSLQNDTSTETTRDSVKNCSYSPLSSIESAASICSIGRGFKGRTVNVKFDWATSGKKKDIKGSVSDAAFDYNIPRLPMPNLHNVGLDVYGGVSQTP